MKKILNFSIAALTALSITACGSDSSSSSSSNDETTVKRDYALAILSGQSIFAGTFSMSNLDNLGDDFYEMGSQANYTVYDKGLYTFDFSGTITRYSLDENNVMENPVKIAMPAGAAMQSIYVNEKKMYLPSLTDTIFIYNPTTMKQTGFIDLGDYREKTATGTNPSSGIIVDGRLYICLLENSSQYTTGDTAKVLIIDVASDSIIAMAKDTRVAAVGNMDDGLNSYVFEKDGYIYFYSTASYGYGGEAQTNKDGFLRIKIGETKFDKDYVFNVSKEIGIGEYDKPGDYKYLLGISPASGDDVYSNVAMQTLSTNAEDYFQKISGSIKLDVVNKTVEVLPFELSTTYSAYCVLYESETSVLIGTSTAKANELYRYNPKKNTKELLTTMTAIPMWIRPLN